VKQASTTLDPGNPLLSPLRYPGSKRRLVRYLQRTIELNALEPNLYVEPFAGGASVALQLGCNQVVEQIGLSDLDPLVASFWRCVFFDTNWLVEAIERVELSVENWEIQKASNPTDDRGRALKCIFLNRTSFSGILAPSAGPIGGKTQSSEYDIGCRFNKQMVINRILKASVLRDRVAFVWNVSWDDCLERLKHKMEGLGGKELFVYLDPPFYYKADRLYSYYFKGEDHRALHDILTELPVPWFLSYDLAEPIMNLYASDGMNSKRIEVLYSAGGSSGAKELIVTNLSKLPSARR
jgi:DNA adenine methylase